MQSISRGSWAALLVFALLAAGLLAPAARAGDQPKEQLWVHYAGHDGPGKGKKIVLVSGDEEYRSEEGLPQLGKILAVHHGFDCTVLFAIDPKTGEISPNYQQNIPGLAALDDADLMIIQTRFRDLPDDQMKHIVDFVMAGKPVIGMRTATHAFNIKSSPTYKIYSWNDKTWGGGFGRRVLGETWINHHGAHHHESTRGLFAPGAESNPILNGIHSGDIWVTTDVYGVRLPMLKSVTPLIMGSVLTAMSPDDKPVEGKKNNPMMPVAWLNNYQLPGGKPGKAFCTTMGASLDLKNEALRRMLVNATYDLLNMKVPEKADVDIVGDYHPHDYGFNGYTKGTHPADHNMK